MQVHETDILTNFEMWRQYFILKSLSCLHPFFKYFIDLSLLKILSIMNFV